MSSVDLANRADRRVPGTVDLEAHPGARHFAHRHLVLGEGAGLVGADHRRAAERLDRREPLDESVAAGHPLGAHRQRQRHRRQQALGHEGHDHPQREHQPVGDLHQTRHERYRTDEHPDPDRHRRDDLRQRAELGLQGARCDLQSLRQGRDPTELGVHPGAEHHGLAAAGRDARSGEHQIRGLRTVGDRCRDRCRILADRSGLPRERRLVHSELDVFDDPSVRRDPIALAQQEHIPRDQLGRVDAHLHRVAQHPRLDREQPPEGVDRPLRLELLPEAEQAVDDDHQHDRDAQLRQTGEQGDTRADPQQECHQMREVPEQPRPQRRPSELAQHVRAGPFQPMCCVDGCQAARRRSERDEDVENRQYRQVVRTLASRACYGHRPLRCCLHEHRP